MIALMTLSADILAVACRGVGRVGGSHFHSSGGGGAHGLSGLLGYVIAWALIWAMVKLWTAYTDRRDVKRWAKQAPNERARLMRIRRSIEARRYG